MIEPKLDTGTGYLYFIDKESPLATGNSYKVYYHRYVMSNYLGRVLASNEHVHHKDGNKINNSIDNLELLSAEEHGKLHNISNKFTIFCSICGKEVIQLKESTKFCSPECNSKAQIKDKKLTKELLDELIPKYTWIALGKLFGYSDNGIKKRAKALGCIIPKRRNIS